MRIARSVVRRIRRAVSGRVELSSPLEKHHEYRAISHPDDYSLGSAEHLIALEKFVGGYMTGVERRTVSTRDHRTAEQIATGGMTGGDRMFHHGYAPAYAAALAPFVANRMAEYTIVEVGILRGTGLAMWSLLFPNARIIGLDIDLSHTEENLPALRARGAFARRPPELYRFDQLASRADDVSDLLGGARIDICVDDGLHSDASIIGTARALRPHLVNRAVYFIEDSHIDLGLLDFLCDGASVTRNGRLTVCSFGL